MVISNHIKRLYDELPDWARVVSDVLSPPVIWGVLGMVVAFGFTQDSALALQYGLIYTLLNCIAPVLLIVFLVWRGKIGDIHMEHRRERYLPLLFTIACSFVAFMWLWWLNAPPAMPLLALITLVEIVIMTLITLAWQISMHAMGITTAVIALSAMFTPGLAFAAVPLVVLVGGARLKLKRHTPMQIFGGTLVGALVPIIVLLLI